MVRVRNLVLAIAAATALTSNTVFALGVGEVRLQSSLNQPLVADIELLDAKGLSNAEIKPRLASVEDFKKLGIDRSFFLTDLKFTPVKRPDGRQVIRVTSNKPVREPYLSFLVEVLWPSGRLLREYTLLFDPPLYAPEVVAQAAPHLPGSKATPLPPASPATPPAASPPAAGAPGTASQGTGGAASAESKEYRVANRDTLWGISERVREVGSVHQNMVAIWDLNPEAFVGGNINRMQKGQVLRLPTADEVTKRSHPEAVAEVSKQTVKWRHNPNGSEQPAGDAKRSTAPSAPAPAEDSDNLRLVAAPAENPAPTPAVAATKTKSASKGGEVQALRNELASTRETLDSSRRESFELKERLNDLQNQLDKLTRLMYLKDNQLVELQGRLVPAPADQQEAAALEHPPVANDPAHVATAQPVAAQPPIVATPVTPRIPSVTEPAEENDLLSFIMANSMMLGAVGGGVLLTSLLALLLLARRKKAAQQGVKVAEKSDPLAKKPRSVAEMRDTADFGEDDEPLLSAAPRARATDDPPAGGEALAKADIYIAYGHLDEAARLLRDAVDNDPNRLEPRLKLMEVYGGMGNREGFAAEEKAVREIGVPEARIRQIKEKFPMMSAVAESTKGGNTLGDLDFDALLDESAHRQAEPAAPSRKVSRQDPLADMPVVETERQSEELASAIQAAAQRREAEAEATVSRKDTTTDDPFADFDWDLSPETGASKSASVADDSPAPSTRKAAVADTPLDDFDLSVDFERASEPSRPDDVPTPPSKAAKASEEDDFMSADSGDEVATKLDLAKAYVEMGDQEGARDILNEVVAEGNDRQKRAARKILSSLA